MRYKGKVYRPPSEAYSLIVQVTYGCSHNRCAFCDMYDDKHFAMRPMAEIREDFELARRVYRRVERVFLADGDALMRRTEELVEILGLVYGLFPECERVTCYASPTSLQIKSEDELRLLRSKGLQMVYMGLESGCDAVLEKMQKGHTAAEIVAAGQKARRCGLALSVTAISGLGSVAHWREHAVDTARAVSEMKPDYLGLLTLMVEPGTPLERDCEEGRLALPPERDQNIMFMEGAAFLEANGYMHYEISNFARMGFQCRHNLGYWEGADYLGLGPSATSTIAGRRWTNPASQRAWEARTREGSLGAEVESLTPTVRVLELIMLRLRTSRGLRLKAYRKLTGRDFLRDHQRLVQALHENGLIRIRNGYLRLTRSGMLVSNSILSNLFERTEAVLKQPLPPGTASPSSAPAKSLSAGNNGPEIQAVVWPSA